MVNNARISEGSITSRRLSDGSLRDVIITVVVMDNGNKGCRGVSGFKKNHNKCFNIRPQVTILRLTVNKDLMIFGRCHTELTETIMWENTHN